ncbi:hypothetical protein B566_EDAN008840 [Ephemera danica]|nr:hypothetical protein B566_EDAN008840 [Ephemera danica]
MLGFLYQMVGSQESGIIIMMGTISVMNATNIIVACAAANDVSMQIHRDRFAALRLIRTGQISESTRTMMQRFCTQMMRICPPVSFNGYVNVGRGLLTTLLGALLTNLAVLVQLRLQQRVFDASDFLNFGETVTS